MSQKRFLFYISQNYSFAILRPLQQAILARGDIAAWFVEGKQVNVDFFEEEEELLLSVSDIFDYSPHAIFYPANLAPTFLPGINVAVFHGFDAGKVDKKGNNDHYKLRHCFDLYCTQGPESTEKFTEFKLQHDSFHVKETGWCAIDPLYQQQKAIDKNSLPTVLFCSTFSRNLTSAPHLFDEIKRLSTQGKYRWLVQFHPKMPAEIVEQYKTIESEYLTFVETDNVIPLLQEADLMVCDTSSVLLMFLLLNKPVVTFNNIAPKDYLINITEPDLLEQSIEHGLTKPKPLMDNIQHFIEQTHPYHDGRSSERVLQAVDEVLSGKVSVKKQKPLNILRQIKMRKRLGYWQF